MTTHHDRALARAELRRLLAAYRNGRGLKNHPALVTRSRGMEGADARFIIFCGRDEARSAALATELINTHGFKGFLHWHNASYAYAYAGRRTTIEIIIP